MSHTFVLVHSPLIGPFSWRLVANQLAAAGHSVTVPSLSSALGRSAQFAEAIVQAVTNHLKVADVPDPLFLVAHSAAGAFLPVIASALERKVSGYVFVDARLPMNARSLLDQDPPEEQEQLRRLSKEGLLPAWSEWFGQDGLADVLPDHDLRRKFIQELRPIPLELFEEPINFPQSWRDAPCSYLRLSEYYMPQAREARAAGWHVVEIDVGHLYLITHPKGMTTLLVEAAAALHAE
jgi:hypothetical protein